VTWSDLKVWQGDSALPGVRGPGAVSPIPASDPRFDAMVCFDGQDFESFYLRHVLGIDPSKADTE
jgi:hypothetical protein